MHDLSLIGISASLPQDWTATQAVSIAQLQVPAWYRIHAQKTAAKAAIGTHGITSAHKIQAPIAKHNDHERLCRTCLYKGEYAILADVNRQQDSIKLYCRLCDWLLNASYAKSTNK